MKLLSSIPLLLLVIIAFTSCQKELGYTEGDAAGTLKKDAAGECLPILINGTYTQGIVLTSPNYVDVQVDINQTGAYLIKTDTINGYSFSASGNIAVAGLSTIRLVGSGKPVAAGVDVFTASFSGTTCQFNIIVNGSVTSPAVFTLGSTAGICNGAVLSGTYMQGLAMSASNTVTLNVNVTTAGNYALNIPSVNGVGFSGSGTFSTIGAQTITLTGSGTPAAAGTFTYPVTAGASNCNFNITYAVAAGPAVYTLSCGTPVLAGTYQAGTAMTAGNTMTVGVNVTSGGTYSITTTSVNGVTFAGTGVLPATPASQTVTLAATGTPAASGTFSYTLNGAATTCTVSVTFNSSTTGDYVRATVDGVPLTFYTNMDAIIAANTPSPGNTYLSIDGFRTGTTPEEMFLTLSVVGTSISPGTYTLNQSPNALIGGAYHDPIGDEYIENSAPTPQSSTFSITIISISATRVTGTFSGPLRFFNVGPGIRTITNGEFSLPLP